MINLVQTVHNLLGSKEDILALENMDHARVLVYSDSHGNYENVKDIILRYGPSCNALAFCGDGIKDLAWLLESSLSDEKLQEAIPPVIAFAKGNGDPSSYPVSFLKDSPTLKVPDRQLLTVNHRNLLVVHGHREGVDFGLDNLAFETQIAGCDTAVFGHTHLSFEFNYSQYKFVNPGSVSLPRGGQNNSFVILTFEKKFTDAAFLEFNPHAAQKEYSLFTPMI